MLIDLTRQMSVDTPHRDTAGLLVSRHIEQLWLIQKSRRMRPPEDILGALTLIRTLNPTPGSTVATEVTSTSFLTFL